MTNPLHLDEDIGALEEEIGRLRWISRRLHPPAAHDGCSVDLVLLEERIKSELEIARACLARDTSLLAVQLQEREAATAVSR